MKGAIVRLGDESYGHGCWPPRPNDTGTTTVFLGGRPIHLIGGHYVTHCCTSGGTNCHDGISQLGNRPPSLWIENTMVAIDGDPISCGDICKASEESVFFGL